MEDEESLETGALVGQLPDAVEDEVYDFLADGVVASSVVVGGIFLASDKLFRMKKLSVCSGADFVDYGGFQVYEDGPGDVFAGASFAEEGVEGVVSTSDALV